jgi:hypothetical protein
MRPLATLASPATTLPAVTTTTAIPPFTSTVSTVTIADLPATYRAGCPVGPSDLRLLRMSYWGFDNQAHTGTMVVHVDVVQDVITVFTSLYNQRFPIRQMVLVDQYGGSDPASMDADNTSGFNCRLAVTSGPASWSAHAYGQAIDVNTVENPYILNGQVMPAAGAAYTDRSTYRPGMAVGGGVLVSAFASVGWYWGASVGDYQHFSKTGA